MQIPQTIINMLSAKGKGYVEAAMKIAEGQRLVQEGTIEMAHLDGKKLKAKEHLNAGGANVLGAVRDLAKPKMTPEYLKSFLKKGPLSSRELGEKVGCALETVRRVLVQSDVGRVGEGNQVKWTLTPAKGSLTRKKIVANKVVRRPQKTPRIVRRKTTDAELFAAIRDAINKNPGKLGTDAVRKLAGGGHARVCEALKKLERAGEIKKTEHEGVNARGRVCVHKRWSPA